MSIKEVREELHKCVSVYGMYDTRTLEKSRELDKLIEVEQLRRETIYFMKRAVQAEKLLKEVQGFCPVLHRNEIRDFLES